MPRVRPRRTRRSRERALLLVLGCLTVILALATVVVGYVVWSLEQVDRLALAESLTEASDAPVTARDIIADRSDGAPLADAAQAQGGAELFEDLAVYRPDRADENYLLVGSDSVEGIESGDDVLIDRDDQAENHLADTIMVLRLRQDGTAAVVSIPRDLLVEVAGTGRTAKINATYNIDDDPAARAARLIDTVELNLGIELQHFVEIDLDGFRRLVDAVGGVTVCFEQPIRDRNTDDSGSTNQGGTGFISDAGNQLLDGEQALQYVRSRHLFVLDGEDQWVRLGYWNDLERNSRQQQFVFDAVDQALAEALSSPSTLRSLLGIVASNLATSDTISLFDDGLDLARLFRSFDADTQLERYAFDFFDVERDGLVGLDMGVTDHNTRVLDVFAGVGWNDVVESRVSVIVTGEDRVDIAGQLQELGFSTSLATGSRTDDEPRLRYGVGGEQAAVVLASHLPPTVELVGDVDLAGNQLVLDLGSGPLLVSSAYRSVSLPPALTPPDTAAPTSPTETVAPAPPETIGVCG